MTADPEARSPSASPAPLRGTLVAFDFGTRRVGVAVGETESRLAHPLEVIDAEANDVRFAAVERIARDWKPVGFVVGRPRHADGGEHEVARLAEKFARRLAARFALPVAFVDETLTSVDAESRLREAHASARARQDVDALAAALILQAYLDDPLSHERLAPGQPIRTLQSR